MAFLDNYEGNKERTDRWIATYPDGRLQAHIVEFNADKGYILVQAKAWRNQTEIEPAGIDYAYGYIAAFNTNMRRWFVEDTCTSALMRVMALVMGGAEKSTKETMHQVKQTSDEANQSYDYWTTKFGDVPSYKTDPDADKPFAAAIESVLDHLQVAQPESEPQAAPECRHGAMRWKQSAASAPKQWAGYFCTYVDKDGQCKPQWQVLTSSGAWKPQV